jgi:LacI family gluconate utilization system Gnt-I transcriptional repressor
MTKTAVEPVEPLRELLKEARPRGPVTLHNVARLANVSAVTVSRALNEPGRVNKKTVQRVLEAVAQTGYVPNLLAGGLRSARSKLVAAIVPSISGGVFAETIQHLTGALARKGYQLLLGQSGFVEGGEDALLDAIIGRRPHGIVLTGIMHSAEGRRRLIASGIPIVETWDLTPTPVDMLVGFSHERLGDEVCRFLVRKGYRRIALISGDDMRARRRHEGFCRAAISENIAMPEVELVASPTNHQKGRLALARVLSRCPDIEAVFCGADALAMGVLTEAQVRGISVPSQLAVVGHGDLNFAATLHPSLTTVHIDYERMANEAAQFIFDRAEGRAIKNRVLDIGFSIVERESA